MNNRQRKPRRIWGALLMIIVLLFACSFSYIIFYHDGPPVPGLEGIFKNPQFEITDGNGSGLKDGYYVWVITNKSDFAWPQAYINFGPNHYAVLGRMEPGAEAPFSNAFLFSYETQQQADLPLLVGQSIELRLVVEYAGEADFINQIKEMLGSTQENYFIATLSR